MMIVFALSTTYQSYAIFTKVIIIFNMLCNYLLILLKLSSLAAVAMATRGTDHEHCNLKTF